MPASPIVILPMQILLALFLRIQSLVMPFLRTPPLQGLILVVLIYPKCKIYPKPNWIWRAAIQRQFYQTL